MSVDLDAAAGPFQAVRNAAHQGGLAGAVRTHETNQFPGTGREGDVIKHLETAEVLCHTLETQRRAAPRRGSDCFRRVEHIDDRQVCGRCARRSAPGSGSTAQQVADERQQPPRKCDNDHDEYAAEDQFPDERIVAAELSALVVHGDGGEYRADQRGASAQHGVDDQFGAEYEPGQFR